MNNGDRARVARLRRRLIISQKRTSKRCRTTPSEQPPTTAQLNNDAFPEPQLLEAQIQTHLPFGQSNSILPNISSNIISHSIVNIDGSITTTTAVSNLNPTVQKTKFKYRNPATSDSLEEYQTDAVAGLHKLPE